MKESWLIPICFGLIYFVWGSTYLANWYAIQDIPPLLMSGSRFVTAGIILFSLSKLFGGEKTTPVQWKNAATLGIMFLAIGTGGMVWSEQYITSGMVALMAAIQPLFILLLMWQLHGKRPNKAGVAGTFLGMIGMVFLVGQDQFTGGEKTMLGLGIIFISILSWGIASVKLSKMDMPSNKLQSAAIQMLAGGGLLLLVSLLSGEAFNFRWVNLTYRGIYSWIYLAIFGSVVSFSAFNYLLVKSTPDKVATANYINPVVAMFLGWALADEIITGQSLIAAVLMLAGVVLIKTKISFFQKFNFFKKYAAPLEVMGFMPVGAVKVIDAPPILSPAIARIWHGVTPTGMSDEYIRLAKTNCVANCEATPGNLGVSFYHQTEGDVTHHTFISYWKDFESVKRFAGEDYEKARTFPGEEKFLVESDEVVEHREM
ncbi:MAG: EamA family transporter [Saprospiraceae bacterium]|nr:EamA family transporter [Saprospiraceae bacterium]MCF8280372.1 EamA family transporter [Bacteroidales bacterium]MCF8312857.1 EamA family transporter [Saprospiraceae bacterium]MCF8441346.1 EamA family transporter [Saprospiraceae bacterium]